MLLMVGGAVGVAVIAVLALILLNNESEGSASNEPVSPPPPIAADVTTEGRTMGDPDAPVTVIEYGDFQ